jgi:hypothetical protein
MRHVYLERTTSASHFAVGTTHMGKVLVQLCNDDSMFHFSDTVRLPLTIDQAEFLILNLRCAITEAREKIKKMEKTKYSLDKPPRFVIPSKKNEG